MENTPNADIGTAENNSESQSRQEVGLLNQETLAAHLARTLFAEPDATDENAQPQAETEGEAQTEVKDETEAEAPAQETEPEQVPKAEDGEEGEVLSQTTEGNEGEDSDLPRGVQKRIDKLTARNKAYEAEIAELKAAVGELKAATESAPATAKEDNSVNDASNPFSALKSKAEVDKEVENARWLRYKCMENPEGFVLGETEYNHEQVRQMLVNATRAIEEHLPRQAASIEARERIEPIAKKAYPWWDKPQSKEYQMAQQVLRNFPAFKRFPDYKMFVGDAVRGMLARESELSKAAPKATSRVPSQPVKPTVAPAKSKPDQVKAKIAEDRFRKSTSAEDLAKVLLSKGII